MSGNKPTRNFFHRRRWAIDQRRKAVAAGSGGLAAVVQPDTDRLAGLRTLAAALEPLPHMAGTLAAVRAEIARLEAGLEDWP